MRARVILRRGLVFALIWWVLAEGRAGSWGVGLISVVLALSVSLWLSPPGQGRFSITGLLRFAGFFLIQSAKGGAQVAALALRPRLDLAPVLLEVPITLPPGPARVLLINTLNHHRARQVRSGERAPGGPQQRGEQQRIEHQAHGVSRPLVAGLTPRSLARWATADTRMCARRPW